MLGLVAYRKFITLLQDQRSIYMVGAMRIRQESYRAETLTVSQRELRLHEALPVATGARTSPAWDNPSHADYTAWRRSARARWPGLLRLQGRRGSCRCNASDAGIAQVHPLGRPPPSPWYVVIARGDVDGNGGIRRHRFVVQRRDLCRERGGMELVARKSRCAHGRSRQPRRVVEWHPAVHLGRKLKSNACVQEVIATGIHSD